MDLVLEVWRQESSGAGGRFETYPAKDVSPDQSFLEMLDEVNDRLLREGKEPIAFDHDCREGICGMCGVMINGQAHGPLPGTTACQLHMREFEKLGVTRLVIEPWRATAFPVVRDLVVDRGALDRIVEAGGFVAARTGNAQDANTLPVRKADSDAAMDAATCIGCGACVANCPNASAMLFTGAKVTHLALLPQGQPERLERAQKMVVQMDEEGFGACTSHAECEATCPKNISIRVIAQMNADFIKGMIKAPIR